MNKEPQLSLPSTALSQTWLVHGEEGQPSSPRCFQSPGEPGGLQVQPLCVESSQRGQPWAQLRTERLQRSEGCWEPEFILQLCLV